VKVRKDLDATWMTLKEARTLKLEVAAPRGQIVDRNGICLAQNKVSNYLALNFPVIDPPTDENVIAFARARITEVNRLLGKTWDVPNERLVQHYKDRRWLPLIFSLDGKFSVELSKEEIDKLKPLFGKGLMLHPTFVRYYPKLNTACHVVGYTGIRQPLPVGAIVEGEPLIEEPMGRSGLELAFENELRGKPGMVSLLFNPDGTKINEEVLRRPVPGNNVVTTLDFNMQRFAEDALRENAKNGGAMVIMDVRNGDVLALASNPTFNPNEFIPGISQKRYDELKNDPKTPLLGRAYQGSYFPASTFKIITALAGLESGKVDANTLYDGAPSYQIGDRVFHNWSKDGEGMINVVDAIKRSCNTWFYQAGLQTGAAAIMGMAERLGFGQATGLPIAGEAKGFVPSDAFYMQRYGHKIHPGILASICIGQVVEASPIQVCQAMCGVADGTNLPKARLVKQVQDFNDNVVQAWSPDVRRRIELQPAARDTVVKGMIAVVNADRGTGHNAQVEGIEVAGKTGTAQWKIFEDSGRNRNLAWFTGFMPARNPVYAFAVVYEGGPGEKVSGGSIAAPIVKDVFTKIHSNAKAEDPLMLAANPPPKAEAVDDSATDAPDTSSAPKAQPAEEAPPKAAAPEEAKGVRGLFKRLFGRG
jgi:penicillin-binding protein 2